MYINKLLVMNNDNNNKIKIRVCVKKDNYPYVTCNQNDKKKWGFINEIWDYIVKKNNWDCEIICLETTPKELFLEMDQGKYDIALGDFSVTHKRQENVLFSRPIYISKLTIVRKSKNQLVNFFNNKFVIWFFTLYTLLILLFTLIHYSAVKNSDFYNSLYITFLNFFVNLKEIFPKNLLQKPTFKFLNALWAFLRYLFYTTFITISISYFVKSKDSITKNEYESIESVLVQKGTSFVDLVKLLGKKPIEIETQKEIVEILNNSKKTTYWFNDIYAIEYKVKEYAPNMSLTYTQESLFFDECAIGVNRKRPDLLKKIDDAILELQDTNEITKICSKYFKREEDKIGCDL